MTALYLHNAVFTSDPSEHTRSPIPHSRNVSTVSSTTLHASASEHSHPTDPLLHPVTPDSIAYIDVFSRQPTLVNEPGPLDWGPSPTLLGDPPTLREKKNMWERTIRRRLKCLRLLMRILEVIYGAWAIYNTVRYFLAFTIYNSAEGQTASLALGICTGISFAFIVSAAIFNFFKLHLVIHSVPLRLVTNTIISLLCLSSLTLIAPAVVNVVLLVLWRNRSDEELATNNRCRIDIDVVWSVSSGTCGKPYGWGTLMALSATRLGITAILIAFYYAFMIAYERTRRPAKWVNPKRLQRFTTRRESVQPVIPPQPSSHSLPDSALHHHTSRSTVVSRSPSKRSTLYHSSSALSTHTSTSERTEAARSPQSEGGDSAVTAPTPTSTEVERGEGAPRMVDRFRSLVSQITRDTTPAPPDPGTQQSHHSSQPTFNISIILDSDSGSGTSSESHPSLFEHNYDFYPPPIPPAVGYNEFGQPYPPEEAVPMLNGFIRRMPTIESVGSREIASSTTTRTTTNRGSSLYSASLIDRLGIGTGNSRPPTRNTLSRTDYTGSEPPSRANSLSLRTDVFGMGASGGGGGGGVPGGPTINVMMSEIGELLKGSGGYERKGSPSPLPSPVSPLYDVGLTVSRHGGGHEQGNGSHSSKASTATTGGSYHTATMGSTSSTPQSHISIPMDELQSFNS